MTGFSKNVEVRWSDMDPNFHLRHSVYYDWGAYMRLTFLLEQGITPAVMQQLHFGPILFREECVFKREIAFGDKVSALARFAESYIRLPNNTRKRLTVENDDKANMFNVADLLWLFAHFIDICRRSSSHLALFLF